MKKRHLTTYEVVLFGVLGALTFAAKYVMSVLPNIEPVSLMVMLFAVTFGWKGLYPTFLYVALEILVFGLGTWNIYYLYVWALLALPAILLRRMDSTLGWAILSAAFGLSFGALCAIADIFIFGAQTALGKWVSGIWFDIIHCAGNFAMALLLFRPLRRLLSKLHKNTP